MDLNAQYYLLLIDVIDSTEISSQAFSDKMTLLENRLIDFNEQNKDDLVLPISISYGDEIAGLFYTPKNIYHAIAEVRRVLYPLTTIRFVVIKDKISRLSNDIRKIGGRVFKRANANMDTLKRINQFCAWELDGLITSKTLESLCKLSNAMIEEMSDYQRSVFELLVDGLAQKQIAVKLGKYEQSVSDAIQRGKVTYILESEQVIHLILKNIHGLEYNSPDNS